MSFSLITLCECSRSQYSKRPAICLPIIHDFPLDRCEIPSSCCMLLLQPSKLYALTLASRHKYRSPYLKLLVFFLSQD